MSAKFQPEKTSLAILGAGTMGSGVALAALYAGFKVVLQDVQPRALARARVYIEKFLARKELGARIQNLTLTEKLEEVRAAEVVIEAAPEDLALKRDLLSSVERVCRKDALLATNTSTLSVTAIAAALQTPERFGGMHFFNPAAVMPLVEVVRGASTNPATVEALVALAEELGKTPVVANDRPGFIVNRVARPYYGEALRLLGEGVAGHEELDTLFQLGAGFRMGPFRLMDLIGIDVNTAAARSIYEQSFGEPRYRPHWLRVQMLEQGALGRKTGRGFYRYAEDEPEFGPPTPPEVGKATGEVWISKGGWGPGFGELAQKAGYRLVSEMKSNPVAGVMIAGRGEGLREWVGRFDETLPPAVPLLVQSVDTSLTEISTWAQNRERLVGFDGWFFAQGSAATLVSNPQLDEMIKVAASKFAESLGRVPVWVKETPALVLPRVVAMLVNEAAFAQLEGIADPDTIDRAMQLGANYPHGPLAWGKRLGYAKVLTVLDHLRAEYGEERYRACTLLRRWARLEENIAASG